MNQLPSERIQEIANRLDIDWCDNCESDTHDRTLRAILVYLDEEYQKSHQPRPSYTESIEKIFKGRKVVVDPLHNEHYEDQ